jgi:predicted metal-dependent peptidase
MTPHHDTADIQEAERVAAIRTNIVIQHPFFATLILPMRLTADPALPTFASTNCVDRISYNPAWTRALTLKQLGYVLLHEVAHIALLHALRKGTREHQRWNHAADYAANAMLDEVQGNNGQPLYERPEKISIPGLGVCSLLTADWVKRLSAEEIYDALPDHQEGANNQHGEHGAAGETCHLDPSPGPTEDQIEQLTDRVIAAHEAWVASQQRGTMPSSFLRLIERLRAARVPWQRVLRQYAGAALAKEDFSLFPPHHRWLHQCDIVRPSCRSERMGQLTVAIDTSGSIGQHVLRAFASEIAALHTLSEETLILTCDAAIHQAIRTQEAPQFLASLSFEGGGGTSHVPIFEWLTEHRVHPDLLVALTDLHSCYPDRRPPYPVVWCTIEDHGDPPPWGRVVVIPDQ